MEMGPRAHPGNGAAARFDAVRGWLRDAFQWSRPSLSYGARCERAAARHLRLRGYRIVARNYRAAGAEIDLVALDGETLVFVEVKARRSLVAGTPEAAVDERKQRHIRRAAEIFVDRHRAQRKTIRFDVIAITGDGRGRKFELLRDAF
jgi:putative endonuclease